MEVAERSSFRGRMLRKKAAVITVVLLNKRLVGRVAGALDSADGSGRLDLHVSVGKVTWLRLISEHLNQSPDE